MDPAVSHASSAAARTRGQRLSSLVESLVEKEISGSALAKAGNMFSSRWAGKSNLAPQDEPHFVKLRRKYEL